MDNKVKVCIAIIVIVILIIICAVALGGKETDETNSNTAINTTNVVENEVQNEVEDETIENKVENTVLAQNRVENQKLSTQDFSSSVYEDKTETGTLSKKEEAINLVKNQWGEDSTVTFSCDSITSDGIYIIAVTSKERAEVLNYFRVNLTTKTVTVDY